MGWGGTGQGNSERCLKWGDQGNKRIFPKTI